MRSANTPRRFLGPATATALLALGLLPGCPAAPKPPPRGCTQSSARCAAVAPKERCPPGRLAKSPLALPRDGCKRYLQGSAPLPLPPDALTVHLELERLRQDVAGRRVMDGAWEGIRADSMAAGLLLPYLKRCEIEPRRDLTAVTFSQPLHGRPDADRVVIFWGLLMAQGVVACLRRAMEADGARTSFIPAGGEPAFSADRPASDLHLDAVALDSATLVVASGKGFRSFLRRLIRGKGRSLANAPYYARALRRATTSTVLLALAPRLPKRLPHVQLPADAHRHLRGMSFALARCGTRCPAHGRHPLQLTGALDVGQQRRAKRWAGKAPGKLRLLALLSPAEQRGLLRQMQITSAGRHLRLHLALTSRDLAPLGRLLSRWLPW